MQRNRIECWLECKLVQLLWKAVWKFLKKLKIEIPFDPGIPLVGIYHKNAGSQFGKDICTPMFITALFTITKKWKQPKCPSEDEWIKKMWYICTMEYYSAIRRKQIYHLQQHGWSQRLFAHWNKPGRERQVPNDFIHLYSIRTKENWSNKTVAESQNPRMD